MRTSDFKRSLALILLTAFILAVSGCFLLARRKTDKKIPTFYTNSKVVSVRYYYCKGGDSMRFEELGADKLDEFISALNSMELEAGGAVDYIASGYGIEMELEDGTYLTYDGTLLALRSSKIVDVIPTKKNEIDGKSDFVYVMNCDFWDVMKGYFPSIEANDDQVYSHK